MWFHSKRTKVLLGKAEALPMHGLVAALMVEQIVFSDACVRSVRYAMSPSSLSAYFFAVLGAALVKADSTANGPSVLDSVSLKSLSDAIEKGRTTVASQGMQIGEGKSMTRIDPAFAAYMEKPVFWGSIGGLGTYVRAYLDAPAPLSVHAGNYAWLSLPEAVKLAIPSSFREHLIACSGNAIASAVQSYWDAD
jgi:hypothetical protein